MSADLDTLIRSVVREEIARALAGTTAAEYLSTEQAGEVAGVVPSTIRRWIRDGRLTPCRSGRLVRVRRADLDALLADPSHGRAVTVRPRKLSPEEIGDQLYRLRKG